MKTGFVCPSGFNMIGSATRNGRTLVAVVLGEKSAVSRAEAAARLLDQGFDTPAAGAATLATLAPYGDTASPNDMHDEICKKKAPEEQSEAAAEAAAKDVPKSPYQEKLDHVPTLVAVGLGGATGPVPKAMLDQGGQELRRRADPELAARQAGAGRRRAGSRGCRRARRSAGQGGELSR